MPCRVRTREKKIELNSRTKPRWATNQHTDVPTREWRRLLGAVWYDGAARLVMSLREAQWCVCDRVLTLRVHDRTTTMRNSGEHTQLRTPRASADTTVTTATSQRDGAERSAASAVPRGMHAAAGERAHAKPRGSARHIGLGAHRDDATPTPGAADAAVGAAPLSPPR